MADIADVGNQTAELFLRLAQANRKAVNETPDEDATGRYCLTCGVKIPAERLQAVPHAVRCFDCQNTIEKQQRNRGG